MAVTATSGTNTGGTLAAAGVGSGLDVQGMVSKLMAIEQIPLTKLATKEAKYQAKLSSLGSIRGALASVQTAAQVFAGAGALKYAASSADPASVAASATGSAMTGRYSVAVSKLAQAQKLVAAGQASASATLGTGTDTTLTFSFGTISSVLGPDVDGYYSDASFAPDADRTAVSVTIGSSNNTLEGIRDAINAAAMGVSASIVNDGGASPYRLVVTADATGAKNSVKITVSGDADIANLLAYDPETTQKLSQARVARDAELSVDGIAIKSASNSVTEAIQGVTLTLAKETTSPISISVSKDSSGVVSAIGALVRAYNAANTAIAGATAKGAVLQGDSGVLGLQRQIVSLLGGVYSAAGTYATLSSLGVSFQKDGTLAFDTSKAGAALSADTTSVMALAKTIGDAIDDAATALLGSSGPITAETEGINRSIEDIGNQRAKLQYRLEQTQARYLKQFSALDTLISSMNATSSYLTRQLDALANLNKQT